MHRSTIFRVWLFLVGAAQFCQLVNGQEVHTVQRQGGWLVLGSIFSLVFLICSANFAILGLIVAYQWPHPNVCCYRQALADTPTNRGCCSLYRTNMLFGILWLLFLVFVVLAHNLPEIAVCVCFALLHWTTVMILFHKFKTLGFPSWHDAAATVVPVAHVVSIMTQAPSSSPQGAHQAAPAQGQPVMGIPVYDIPLTTVTVNAPASRTNSSCGAAGRPVMGEPAPLPYTMQAHPAAAQGMSYYATPGMNQAAARAGPAGSASMYPLPFANQADGAGAHASWGSVHSLTPPAATLGGTLAQPQAVQDGAAQRPSATLAQEPSSTQNQQ